MRVKILFLMAIIFILSGCGARYSCNSCGYHYQGCYNCGTYHHNCNCAYDKCNCYPYIPNGIYLNDDF